MPWEEEALRPSAEDGWMPADILATEITIQMRKDFKIPFANPADWVEPLPQELGEWLGTEMEERATKKGWAFTKGASVGQRRL